MRCARRMVGDRAEARGGRLVVWPSGGLCGREEVWEHEGAWLVALAAVLEHQRPVPRRICLRCCVGACCCVRARPLLSGGMRSF